MTIQKTTNHHSTLKLKEMKKMLYAALIAVFVTTSAFAGETVNGKISESFKSDFSDASNVVWTTGNEFAKASFILEGEKMEAFYSLDGTAIGVSRAIALDKLPKASVRTITKKYPFPPYALKECIEFVHADGEVKYYVSLEEEAKNKIILEVSANGSVEVYKKSKIK
jgi:hypothetical protein